MKNLLLLLLFCALLFPSQAQVFTDSNLPIVLITTDNGAGIPDEPGVLGDMKIIYRGPGLRNYVTDKDSAQFLDYSGRIDIEIRGSYSQTFAKKAYGFTTLQADNITNNNVSLLNMPAENDWILNGLSSDPSLIRDYLSINLSRKIGQYASRTAYCEVMVNGNYRGVYLLEEKIKPDKNRVNVVKIQPGDNTLPALSGGYITKTDKPTGYDPISWYMSSYNGFNDNGFIQHWPEPELATIQQQLYIKSVFTNLQTACTAGNNSITTGIPSIIDIPSFVDFMLVNELASNADAYTFSTFYHKDKNGKLRAGPVWDLNLTYGNDLFVLGFDRSKPDVWQFSDGGNDGPKYIRDLYNNTQFKCYLSRRWHALTQPGQPFHAASLFSYIDSTVVLISEAAVRENSRWGTVGNHAQAISSLKSWLNTRIPWISGHIGPYSACLSVYTPPLVISRIHYHPDTYAAFPDEDKLEFLEITNAATTHVDLTGIYFGGTGLVYQFPNGASLPPGAVVVLASDTATYRNRYGVPAFGQYTRNLSNSNQRLQLLDAFGNEIDQVHYFDDAPWPDADGNGHFLQLISLSLDNSLASSWIAIEDSPVDTESPSSNHGLHLYPNPTTGTVQLTALDVPATLIVTDPHGRMVARFAVQDPDFSFDLSAWPNGLYMIQIVTEKEIRAGTVLKF